MPVTLAIPFQTMLFLWDASSFSYFDSNNAISMGYYSNFSYTVSNNAITTTDQ